MDSTNIEQTSLADILSNIVNTLNGWMWGYYLVALLLLVGLFYSIRMRLPQITLARDIFKVITERDPKARGNKDHISPYEALMISMGTRIGMGTIVGMAVAIVVGGPGAVIWVWIAAFLSGAIAVAENTLGQIYKSKDGGAYKGGPPYYLTKGLKLKKISVLYSFITLVIGASFIALYGNTIYSSLETYLAPKDPSMLAQQAADLKMYVGGILVIFAGIMFFGGGRYIAKFASYVTPFMVIVFIIVTIISIIMHIEKTPEVISMVLKSAFDFKAIFGGFAGSVVVIGIQRGLFSNEAGLGSVPAASSSAHTSHPVKQGLVQAFTVFTDTVVATLAMLFVLYSDSYHELLARSVDGKLKIENSMPLIQSAMHEIYGIWGEYYITFVLIVLTSTVIIGNYYVGTMKVKYLSTSPIPLFIYRVVVLLILYLGVQMSVSSAWSIANLTMGVGATVNIIGVFLLAKVAKIALDDYIAQRKQGLNPTFSAKKLGIKNAECWD